ncbi:hypothetical protein C8R45DRAFT_933836 [Mycena sanguinolenta]|nr:hypothetical protein C8R45DRAFT_933836 [Mycena sanguinolenta]
MINYLQKAKVACRRRFKASDPSAPSPIIPLTAVSRDCGAASLIQLHLIQLRRTARILQLAIFVLAKEINVHLASARIGKCTPNAHFLSTSANCTWRFAIWSSLLRVHPDRLLVLGFFRSKVASLHHRAITFSILFSPHRLSFIRAMPYQKVHSIADMAEEQRVKVLARIGCMNPHDACDALSNIRPYLEPVGGGCVYTHMRPNWEQLQFSPTTPLDAELDYLDLKIGQTGDLETRRAAYAKCRGEPIVWCYYYPTAFPKLIASAEHLTHITLAHIGAKRASYPCWGCLVRHREHVSEHYADLELVATTIEYWMRRIGEVPVRHEMYDE